MKSAHSLPSRRARFVPAIFLILIFSTGADAQTTNRTANSFKPSPNDVDQAYIREHYTKYEYKIPMRDGVKLFAAVYAPKDDSKPYPILLTRTPYSAKPYGEDVYGYTNGPIQHYGKERFIFALEDVRGRNGSEGQFVHMRPEKDEHSGTNDIDESTDAYDTIDWLVKNVPNNNGKVGMMGISYPGFYTAAGMIN